MERAIQSTLMKSSLVRACVLLGAACAPVFATAQLRTLDSTRNGRGTLNYMTRSSANTVRKARVYLNSNKRAEISLLAGAMETFSGTWKSGGLTKVYVEIDKVGRDRATGTGQIVHDARGELVSIYCTGNVDGRKFELKFDADTLIGGGNGGGNGGGQNQLRITSPRDGATINNSSGVDIEGMSRGTDVNVKVYDNSRRLVVNRNVNVKRDRWSTHVNLDRGRYRVEVRDQNSRKTDEVSFTYRDNGGNDVREQEFKDNAKDAIREKFRGYEIVFTNTTVGREALGNRTVKGDFEVRGKGSRKGEYRMTVLCGAGTAKVKSVDYSRK